MKLIRKILVGVLLFAAFPAVAQISFFKGTYEEALKKAVEEKKELFVDCWAAWCAPCKKLAEEVFPDPEMSAYFNDHFVAIQLNVEEAANKEIVQKYAVEALPTLLFISRDNKELRRVTGFVPAAALLREAKIALGKELSFEQLYSKYKKNKKDFDIQQQLLIEAPAFMATQNGYDREKWTARIQSLFPEYVKNKKLTKMINTPDFLILTMYHPQTTKEDPIFDFVVKHYDEFIEVIDTNIVGNYLMRLNNSYIIQLCKQGNLTYKDRINQIDGGLAKVYGGFSFGSLSVKEAITLLADATYYLNKRNLAQFFQNMDKYFEGKGEQLELVDYTQPLENLAMAYAGELPEEAYSRCIPWIGKALEFQNAGVETRTRLLVMLGQCFQHTDNTVKAKQCYNQAFLECTQIPDPVKVQQFKQMIQQSLESVE